jgi:hypothetical protein
MGETRCKQAQSSDRSSGLTRRYDVDWLRVLGMMVVFLFHNARFFTRTAGTSRGADNPGRHDDRHFAVQWMMPLFFILSGWGVSCPRPPGLAAVPRLRVSGGRPWYSGSCDHRPGIFGRVIWSISGSFWSWYPHYFEGWFGLGGNFAWMGVHLWYLEALFVFSLLTLPLFLILQSRCGDRLAAALSRALTMPGPIFLLALPIAIMDFIANSPALKGGLLSQRGFGGWSLLPYFAIFIIGFFLAGREQMAQVMERHRFAGLIVGVLTLGVAWILAKEHHLSKAASPSPRCAGSSAGAT